MTDEEYNKLMNVMLKMRTAESILAEAVEELRRANDVIRELILKQGEEVKP